MAAELSKDERNFIDANIANKTPDEIANFLGVESEAVCEYIAHGTKPLPDTTVDLSVLFRRLEDLRKAGIAVGTPDKPACYSFKVIAMPDGRIDLALEWPIIRSPEEFVMNVGALLYLVNSGKLKPMVVEKMVELAKMHNIEGLMSGVMRKWKELDNGDVGEPCIKPREVFG